MPGIILGVEASGMWPKVTGTAVRSERQSNAGTASDSRRTAK